MNKYSGKIKKIYSQTSTAISLERKFVQNGISLLLQNLSQSGVLSISRLLQNSRMSISIYVYNSVPGGRNIFLIADLKEILCDLRICFFMPSFVLVLF
jgi:hypothetical protein